MQIATSPLITQLRRYLALIQLLVLVEHCKGFGRIIAELWTLTSSFLTRVKRSKKVSLSRGQLQPFMSVKRLLHYAKQKGVSTTTPHEDLPEDAKKWIWDGDPEWRGHWKTQWYGIHRFFVGSKPKPTKPGI